MTTPLEISLTGRDFLRISELVPAEAEAILDRAVELRRTPKQPLLPGATLGLFFAKHSTRTRVSFTAGMAQLGGAAEIPRLSHADDRISRGISATGRRGQHSRRKRRTRKAERPAADSKSIRAARGHRRDTPVAVASKDAGAVCNTRAKLPRSLFSSARLSPVHARPPSAYAM